MTPANPDLQKLRELGYDAIADEIANGLKRWDNGLAMRRPSIVKDYLDRNAGIHVHVLIGVNEECSPPHKYCISFQREIAAGDEIGVSRDIFKTVGSESDTFLALLHAQGGQDGQFTMLVDPVQLVKLPEWMRRICASSVVRLQSFDDSAGGWCNAPNLSRFVSCGQCITEYRELGIGDLSAVDVGGGGFSQRERQMIERRSQIKQAVAGDDAQPVRNTTSFRNAESSGQITIGDWLRRSFRVWFVNDGVGFSIEPRLDFMLKSVEMFVCPIQFEGKTIADAH